MEQDYALFGVHFPDADEIENRLGPKRAELARQLRRAGSEVRTIDEVYEVINYLAADYVAANGGSLVRFLLDNYEEMASALVIDEDDFQSVMELWATDPTQQQYLTALKTA